MTGDRVGVGDAGRAGRPLRPCAHAAAEVLEAGRAATPRPDPDRADRWWVCGAAHVIPGIASHHTPCSRPWSIHLGHVA